DPTNRSLKDEFAPFTTRKHATGSKSAAKNKEYRVPTAKPRNREPNMSFAYWYLSCSRAPVIKKNIAHERKKYPPATEISYTIIRRNMNGSGIQRLTAITETKNSKKDTFLKYLFRITFRRRTLKMTPPNAKSTATNESDC